VSAPAGDRWQRDPQVLWRRIGDGLVVLPPDQAACLAVSGATGLLWELLAEPVDADGLVERMAAVTGADPAAVQDQVEVGLQVLAEAGVLRPAVARSDA